MVNKIIYLRTYRMSTTLPLCGRFYLDPEIYSDIQTPYMQAEDDLYLYIYLL